MERIKQGGENGSRVGRMEAGWGEWKQGRENGSRVGRMEAGWGEWKQGGITLLPCFS